MDDLLTTMKAQLYERVASPLTVSFILSWCVWNFRLLAVLMSSMDPTAKFRMIDNVLYPDSMTFWLYRVGGPLITSLLYVFVYPYPERWAFTWAKKKQRDLRSIQAALDSDVPLTPEQSRELRLKCKKTVEDTQAIVEEHQEKIGNLMKEIAQLKSTITQQETTITNLEKRAGLILLTDDQLKILEILKPGSLGTDSLKENSGFSRILTDEVLNELAQLGCVRQFNSVTSDRQSTIGWAITQLGLQALLRLENSQNNTEMTLARPVLHGVT